MRLANVECARGIAALAVVLFHTEAAVTGLFGANMLEGLFRYGEHGVDFFFVLSGFIITYVHFGDIGQANKFPNFLLKRLVRLYPLVWTIAGLWMLMRLASGNGVDHLSIVATSLLLFPSLEEPVPIVLWTLRHEVLFYAVFSILILQRPVAQWLAAIWLALCCMQVVLSFAGKPIEGIAAFYLSTFNNQFLFGAFIGYIHRRMTFAKSIWPFVFGLIAVISAMMIETYLNFHRLSLGDYTSPVSTGWVLVLGLIFAFLLHGILRLPPQIKPHKYFVLLGSASFAIYLIQIPVITILKRLMVKVPHQITASILSYVVFVCASLAAGILVHLFIERHLTELLRQKLMRQPIAAAM